MPKETRVARIQMRAHVHDIETVFNPLFEIFERNARISALDVFGHGYTATLLQTLRVENAPNTNEIERRLLTVTIQNKLPLADKRFEVQAEKPMRRRLNRTKTIRL